MIKHMLLGKKGFTLVEIMFAIALISILASISFIGYTGYQDNSTKTQIESTAAAYQATLKAYAQEKEKFPDKPFCVPSGSKCCYVGRLNVPQTFKVYCGTDAESGWTPGTLSDDVNKYVKNANGNSPIMPNSGTFPACTAGLLSSITKVPCNGTSSIKMGMTYSPKAGFGLWDSADVNTKGMLMYFVDPKFDCGSDDVTVIGNSSDKLDYAIGHTSYSDGISTPTGSSVQYKLCIIGIRYINKDPITLIN